MKTTRERAAQVIIKGIRWIKVPIEQIIVELQTLVFSQVCACFPEDVPPGLHLVYLSPCTTAPILVTLLMETAISLPRLLDLLAKEAALSVLYTGTGIVLVHAPSPEAKDCEGYIKAQLAEPAMRGADSVIGEPVGEQVSASIFPAAGNDVAESIPAAANLIPWLDKLSTIEAMCSLLSCGAFETPVRRRFCELARACQWWPGYLMGCVDLVMIYPPRDSPKD